MKYAVFLVSDAERDLIDIFDYLAKNDSLEQAREILTRLEKAVLALKTLPNRGNCPPELERIGLLDYREIHEPPYRILYQVRKNEVFVHCVLDSRRDLRTILLQRLLR